MKKIATLCLPMLLIACSEPVENANEPNIQNATDSELLVSSTNDEYKKQLDSLTKGVSYKLNDDGIVVFENVTDMMTVFNDYAYEGQFKVSGDNPVNLELYGLNTETNTKNNLEYDRQKALIYGIYKSFTHTDLENLTVNAGVKDAQNLNKVILEPMTLNVTKEQALKALQNHTDAQSFKDLVADSNADFVIKGYSGSKINEMLYKDEVQKAIIHDLQK